MAGYNENVTVLPPTLKPAISPSVHLSLTIAYIILYGLLFLIVYAQLWMILYYKHRRFSYQTVFLFLCLIWSGLRTTLFSFYFNNCILANNLPVLAYWLLYCCPSCLQFITLCLLVLFFASVVFRASERSDLKRYQYVLWVATYLAIAIFTATNLTCSILDKNHENATGEDLHYLSVIRVVINDSLFIIAAVALSVCLFYMTKVSSTSVVLEARGTTVTQALAACILVMILFVTRAVYNMVAISKTLMISFGYGWINVSDQADAVDLNEGLAYVSFGIVLFVWEFLPTFVVVMFFRVKKPQDSSMVASSLNIARSNSRAFFFDNPRRYDSEDDLSRSHISRVSTGSNSSGDPYTLNSGAASQYGSFGGESPPGVMQVNARAISGQFASLADPAQVEPQYYDGT